MSKGMNLKVPSELEQERLDRLQQFIDLKAPRFIVIRAAEQYIRSYRWSLGQTWFDWSMRHCPHWLLWLTNSLYRQVMREDDN